MKRTARDAAIATRASIQGIRCNDAIDTTKKPMKAHKAIDRANRGDIKLSPPDDFYPTINRCNAEYRS